MPRAKAEGRTVNPARFRSAAVPFARSLIAGQRAGLAATLMLVALAATAQDVTLTARDGSLSVSGTLLSYDGEFYSLRTEYGDITLDGQSVRCEGPACPTLEDFVAEVVFSGSAAIGEKLMPALLSEFARARGFGLSIEPGVRGERHFVLSDPGGAPAAVFTLRGATTADGFRDLVNDTADIAMTLRPARADEVAAGLASGIGRLYAPRQQLILGLDALVLVTSPDNPVKAITLEQARGILSGRIDNWAELGGPDLAITVLVPPADSAVMDELNVRLLGPARLRLREDVTVLESAAILDARSSRDPAAFGVATLGSVNGARALSFAGGCDLLLRATPRNVRTEDYPLSTRMFLHLPARRLPLLARDFLAFVTTDPAQEALARLGFVGQNITRTPFDALGNRLADTISAADGKLELADLRDMVDALRGAELLSAVFRFEAGSTRMDVRARANLELLARRIEAGDFDGRELIIAGFTDATGSPEANRRIARQRANEVRSGLIRTATRADLSLVSFRIEAFGPMSPIACDDSEEGRAINRRVEVWVR